MASLMKLMGSIKLQTLGDITIKVRDVTGQDKTRSICLVLRFYRKRPWSSLIPYKMVHLNLMGALCFLGHH